jgi:phage tail-like protein
MQRGRMSKTNIFWGMLISLLVLGSAVSDVWAPVTDPRDDPTVGFHFALEINGTVFAYFTSVSGIGSENEIVEQKVVDKQGNELVRKLPGRLRWQDVTLRRGISSDKKLWEWRQQVENGQVSSARKNFSIIMFDSNLSPIAEWTFTNGWPSKITAPQVETGSTNRAFEEMVIVHEGMRRMQ